MDEKNIEMNSQNIIDVEANQKEIHSLTNKKSNRSNITTIALSVVLSGITGFGGGYYASMAKQANANKPAVVYQSVNTSNVSTTTSGVSITDIAALTANSVVEISTESMVTGTFMQQAISKGAGSGVIISNDGYIITNNHVVDGANKISVRLKDGTLYEASLIGQDLKSDVAVIKIQANGLQAAVFGNSDTLKVGEAVIAVGNPLGQLGGTVTNGIISALDREITIDNETMNLLQTNAAINPGNSGGGLFNMKGELIGIVNAKSSGSDIEGLGFAIPANNAKAVMENLIQYGYVKGRVQLGVKLLDIQSPQMAMSYRVNDYGVYIQEVTPNSAASKGGLKIGDRIVSFDKVKITQYQDLKNEMNKKKVGDIIEIVVDRYGTTKTFKITLEEYHPYSSETKNS